MLQLSDRFFTNATPPVICSFVAAARHVAKTNIIVHIYEALISACSKMPEHCPYEDCQDGKTCVCTGPFHSIWPTCSDGHDTSPCCVDNDCKAQPGGTAECGNDNRCTVKLPNETWCATKKCGDGETCVCTGPFHSINPTCSDGYNTSPCCVDNDCKARPGGTAECGNDNRCIVTLPNEYSWCNATKECGDNPAELVCVYNRCY